MSLPDLNPNEGCRELALAGFTGVEWKVGDAPYAKNSTASSFLVGNLCTLDETLESARRGREIASAAGLDVVGLAPYVETGQPERLRLMIDMAVAAGADQVRVQGPRPRARRASYAHLVAEFLELLAEGAAYGAERGVALAIELHQYTIAPSVGLVLPLLRAFSPDQVGIIYDVGNLVQEGYEDPHIAFELLGPYLRHVHLKNVRAAPSTTGVWEYQWAHLDDGLVNVPAILGLLDSIAYDGWVSIEDLSWQNGRESIRFNADALSRFGAPGWHAADLTSQEKQ